MDKPASLPRKHRAVGTVDQAAALPAKRRNDETTN
jgi:hypothetical protein